jgi:hypothetical protein
LLFAVERFDRSQLESAGNRVRRLHAQDFCQALGRPGRGKYEWHEGPSFAECFRLLEGSGKMTQDQIIKYGIQACSLLFAQKVLRAFISQKTPLSQWISVTSLKNLR